MGVNYDTWSNFILASGGANIIDNRPILDFDSMSKEKG